MEREREGGTGPAAAAPAGTAPPFRRRVVVLLNARLLQLLDVDHEVLIVLVVLGEVHAPDEGELETKGEEKGA